MQLTFYKFVKVKTKGTGACVTCVTFYPPYYYSRRSNHGLYWSRGSASAACQVIVYITATLRNYLSHPLAACLFTLAR